MVHGSADGGQPGLVEMGRDVQLIEGGGVGVRSTLGGVLVRDVDGVVAGCCGHRGGLPGGLVVEEADRPGRDLGVQLRDLLANELSGVLVAVVADGCALAVVHDAGQVGQLAGDLLERLDACCPAESAVATANAAALLEKLQTIDPEGRQDGGFLERGEVVLVGGVGVDQVEVRASGLALEEAGVRAQLGESDLIVLGELHDAQPF